MSICRRQDRSLLQINQFVEYFMLNLCKSILLDDRWSMQYSCFNDFQIIRKEKNQEYVHEDIKTGVESAY